MNSKLFKEELNKIEVPLAEATKALQLGIKQAGEIKKKKRKRKYIFTGVIFSAAISAVLLFTLPMDSLKVLASVPVIKDVLEFRIGTGKKLQDIGEVTPIGTSVNNQTITLTVESIYYDGGQLGILYSYSGAPKLPTFDSLSHMNLQDTVEEKIADTNLAIKNEDSTLTFYSNQTVYENNDGVYFGELIYDNFKGGESADTTLDLKATEINGVQGSWEISVPVQKLKSKVIKNNTVITTKDNVDIRIAKIIQGKAITTVEFSVDQPKKLLEDAQLNFLDPALALDSSTENQGILFEGGASYIIERQSLSNGKERVTSRAILENPDNLKTVMASFTFDYLGENVALPLTNDTPQVFSNKLTNQEYQMIGYQQTASQLFIDIQIPNSTENTMLIEQAMPTLGTKKALSFVNSQRIGSYSQEERDMLAERTSEFVLYHTLVTTVNSDEGIYRVTFDLNQMLNPTNFDVLSIKLNPLETYLQLNLQTPPYTVPDTIDIPLYQK